MKRQSVLSCLWLLPFVVLCSGCATVYVPARQFVPVPQMAGGGPDKLHARVVLISPTLRTQSSGQVRVWDSGRSVGDMCFNSFLCWDREPGTAVITVKGWHTSQTGTDDPSDEVVNATDSLKLTCELRTEGGRTYNVVFRSGDFGRSRFVIVDDKKGETLLAERLPPDLVPKPGATGHTTPSGVTDLVDPAGNADTLSVDVDKSRGP